MDKRSLALSMDDWLYCDSKVNNTLTKLPNSSPCNDNCDFYDRQLIPQFKGTTATAEYFFAWYKLFCYNQLLYVL